MESFSISKVYKDKHGISTIDISPLSHKCCSFDCVFCPLGKTILKTDNISPFEDTKKFIHRLELTLDSNLIQAVFINPNGEAMANGELLDIVELIRIKGKYIRILTNGYILNNPENREVLELCQAVIGELFVTKEEDFQKLCRPIIGYTLDNHIKNMIEFKKWFKGKFTLDITLIKNYSDSDASVDKLREIVDMIKPDEVNLETPDKDKFKGAFTVDDDKLNHIRRRF